MDLTYTVGHWLEPELSSYLTYPIHSAKACAIDDSLSLGKADIGELLGIGLPIVRQIREGILSISQLPDELFDAVGRIRKPSAW